MAIEPLTFQTLGSAKRLLNRVFPEQYWWEKTDLALPIALYKDCKSRPVRKWLSRVVLRIAGVSGVKYWVATRNGEVIGTTGYYTLHKDDDEVVWGAWSCVDSDRKDGLSRIGGMLLRTAAREAKGHGKQVLRLYTNSKDQGMHNFLMRRGFKKIREREERGTGDRIIFLEAPLESLL